MKKLCGFLMTAALILCLCVGAAAQDLQLVLDDAGLLTESEKVELTEQLLHIQTTCDVDIVVVTAQTLGRQSAESYANSYYDDHGYGTSGVLLLVDMELEQWYISPFGQCMFKVNINDIADTFLPYLSDGEYYDAFMTFAACCEKAVYASEEGEPVITDSSGVSQQTGAKTVLICLTIGLAVGLITVLIMRGRLKSVRSQKTAGNYVKEDLKLTKCTDMFLYHTTTRRAKPQNNGSHRSSSGRSHGGGGRF